MKLNIVLTQVLKNLGVDTASEDAQKLLGNTNLTSIEVAESVSNHLTAEYFTKESALQNPEIRSKIKAETLNGIDAQTKDLMTQYELDPDTVAEIMKEDKSSKKLSKLVDKVAELTRNKSKASTADKDAMNQEISKLNKQIIDLKNDYESKITQERAARKGDRINWELDSIYNGLEYALAAEKNISITAAKAIIGQVAKEKGLKFETGDAGMQILTAEGTEYFENNLKITPQDFIKKTLTENKLLKVSDTRTETQGARTQQQNFRPSAQTTGNQSFDAAIDSLIQTNTK